MEFVRTATFFEEEGISDFSDFKAVNDGIEKGMGTSEEIFSSSFATPDVFVAAKG